MDNANRFQDRVYRSIYRQLPWALAKRIPSPRADVTKATRMCIVSLLCSLGSDALSATPLMIRTLDDQDNHVRQLAIAFFTAEENQNCPLCKLEEKTKASLLPIFLRSMNDENLGIRNNAALALRFYPESRAEVAPVLIKALKDSVPIVRDVASKSLWKIDYETARRLQMQTELDKAGETEN